MKGGMRKWGIAHLLFLSRIQWWFSVTGTVSGAPFSFQSGINSLRAMGSLTAPDRMCAPISLPLSSTQTETSRPASAASRFRRMPALRPAGPPPTITTSYCMDSSWLMALSSRQEHNSTRLPCQFLDPAVNAGEESRMGGETESIGFAEARSALAWWLESGVDVAIQDDPRDWLKPPPPRAPASTTPAEPSNVVQPSQDTLAELQQWLSSSVDLPFAGTAARRVLPHGPENAAVMLLTDAPTLEDASAGQPI